MPTERTLYGVVAVLIALALLTSSVGLYYFFMYTQASAASDNYLSELSGAQSSYEAAAARYNALATTYGQLSGSYNRSAADLGGMVSLYNSTVSEFNSLSATYGQLSSSFNKTLSLLASSVAVLNTSEPAYVNASRSLSSLWKQYASITRSYRDEVSLFDSSFSAFGRLASEYRGMPNASGRLLQPVRPVSTSLLTTDILIDFGNGTRVWSNATSVQPGWNLYIATLLITNGNVQATWYQSYPPSGEHFITGIDGVADTQTSYWFLWSYNSTSLWQLAPLGADQIQVYNGTVYGWAFCAAPPPSYNPQCALP